MDECPVSAEYQDPPCQPALVRRLSAELREGGFNLVEQISRDSTDAESREQARRAMVHFVYFDGLLNRIATHLNEGLASVDAAHTATRQAMTLVTRWREGS